MTGENIILFDGVCNLCNASVRFIISRDPEKKFQFLPLQNYKSSDIIGKIQLPALPADSFLLISSKKVFSKSTAALKVARELNGPVKLLYAFIIIPPFIRDFFYNILAANRYRWFGKKESCSLPSPDIRERFI